MEDLTMTNDEREIRRKLAVLKRAEELGSAAKAYRYFGIPKSTFFRWQKSYRQFDEKGLVNKKPIPHSHPNQTPDEIVEKILYLRKKYHLGPIRIMWYMARYHELRVGEAPLAGTIMVQAWAYSSQTNILKFTAVQFSLKVL
jgi:transposase